MCVWRTAERHLGASASHLSGVQIRNRKEHLLSPQRSDTIQTELAGLQIYCSHPAVWSGQQECWISEATWVYWQKQQLFRRWGISIFSSCPNLLSLPFITLQTPETPPTRLICQACTLKRQMQKLCVDVSVREWIFKSPWDSPPHSILQFELFREDGRFSSALWDSFLTLFPSNLKRMKQTKILHSSTFFLPRNIQSTKVNKKCTIKPSQLISDPWG